MLVKDVMRRVLLKILDQLSTQHQYVEEHQEIVRAPAAAIGAQQQRHWDITFDCDGSESYAAGQRSGIDRSAECLGFIHHC